MIILVGASAIYLAGLQASINAPRSAFQTCLKDAVDKASAQKVASDGYEAFARTSCRGQIDSFKSAVIGFDMKNRMSRKDAGGDADSMIADFVSGSADHYRYVLQSAPVTDAAAPAKAATASAPAATPAAVPATEKK
jgi:hypothetical protein